MSYGYGPGRGNQAIFGQPNVTSSNSGSSGLRSISIAELATHASSQSLWIGFKGFVYDATDYRHSGGAQAILRGAGTDATQRIARQHSWVNVDEILKDKKIGRLIS